MEDKSSLEVLLNSFMPNDNTQKKDTEKDTADKNLYTRQINALSAAIPFLDREYQKNIFIVVKFLEFKRFMEERPVVAMQSKENGFGILNINQMADAMRKNLNKEEQRNFDMLFKIFMLKNMTGGKLGGL